MTLPLQVLIQNPTVVTAGGTPASTVPDLGVNAPIRMALLLTGTLRLEPPPPDPGDYGVDENQLRVMGGTVVSLPTPCIVNGRPTLPRFWARSESQATSHLGGGHVEVVGDPNPVWDVAAGDWSTPPPASGVGDARWTVDTLPDPADGFYRLGTPAAADGTLAIESDAQQWAPDGSTPGAPTWHSFYPFKPSVRAVDSYLSGGTVVHHPKGVYCTSSQVQHLWLDFGADRPQPFTVLVVAMVASFTDSAVHHLLDAGRDPSAVGFPPLTADQLGTPRTIADGLAYRTALEVGPSAVRMSTAPAPAPGRVVSAPSEAALRPKMYVALFDGPRSMTGAYDAAARRLGRGTVDDGPAYRHRYLVLGRQQGLIARGAASDVIVFEVRYWRRALTLDELDEQYGQLSSTFKFNQYRTL